MGSEHSKGPWEARKVATVTNGYHDIVAADGTQIGRVYGANDAECVANARLIASAPTLLAERDELREALRESNRLMHAVPCPRARVGLPQDPCVWCAAKKRNAALLRRLDAQATSKDGLQVGRGNGGAT